MSRLTDLLEQVRSLNPQVAADLEAEVRTLNQRRTFGLVFEPHQPEAVQLPKHPVRRGNKVRVLTPRGDTSRGDQRLWRVQRVEKATKLATLVEMDADEPETKQVSVEDVVVVAEFRDTIYPGLVETGRIERGSNKPFHTVINAENFHALELLTYTHRHKVDAIYIDPPYNTGAKDWKYNNDYVASDDDYRHSKWLAFMERRLKVARELLNPENSVLIVTIDEKEYLRLGLLLEQTFPEARIQMVTSMTNKKGSTRPGRFSRSDEYIFCVYVGAAMISPSSDNMMLPKFDDEEEAKESITIWNSLLRRGTDALRKDRPNMFFPIYVDIDTKKIVGVGNSLPLSQDRHDFVHPIFPEGNVVVCWPLRKGGIEGRWQTGPENLRKRVAEGRARGGEYNKKTGQSSVVVIKDKQMEQIRDGYLSVVGQDSSGAMVVKLSRELQSARQEMPRTIWVRDSHDASIYGSTTLLSFLPGRKFPFPKSLYAVEDTLRFFVKDKPDAVILDFFSGSGTTAHAVMRLNRQDGGRRQCISVTNNEVGADEQKKLLQDGLRHGDDEWEQWGICDYITKPRIQAAITGKTPDGEPIKGDYKFTDEFPMAEGFEENAAFFTLTYEAPRSVSHHKAFERIAPLLWLRAGSEGRIITDLGERGWDVSERYGVLHNLDDSEAFLDELRKAEGVRLVYIVTDDDAAFQMMHRELPDGVTSVRLYESYLQNFRINSGRIG